MSLVSPYRNRPFSVGANRYSDAWSKTGMSFSIVILDRGKILVLSEPSGECAFLVVEGGGTMTMNGQTVAFERLSWIEDNPVVAHLPSDTTLTVTATMKSRFALIATMNRRPFAPRFFMGDDIAVEHRGKNLLDDTSYRLVRLCFDRKNSEEAATLVLGEVLNFPGRWSSYPPHHHPQPELYYYETAPAFGYGHGELGEEVFKIYDKDLLLITDNKDHSQVAAPGFHLYYIWAIRHLPESPYTGFTYTKPYERLVEK